MRPVAQDVHRELAVVGVRHFQEIAAVGLEARLLLRVPRSAATQRARSGVNRSFAQVVLRPEKMP